MAVLGNTRLGLADVSVGQSVVRSAETGSWSAKTEDERAGFAYLKPASSDTFKSVPREG